MEAVIVQLRGMSVARLADNAVLKVIIVAWERTAKRIRIIVASLLLIPDAAILDVAVELGKPRIRSE